MRNRDLRPAAKANPTIQQAFERFQKYNRLKNLSQGSLDFYAAKGRSFFRFLGDTEQPIHTITEETVEDYIFYMKDQQLHDTTINTNLRMVRAFLYWCMHLFRHTYAKLYIQAGGDPFRLQKLLGHADLTMTRRYVALYADDLRANYDALNPLEQLTRQNRHGDKIKMGKEE